MKDVILVILKDYMGVITLFFGALLGFLFSILKDKISENRKVEKEKNELALKRLDETFLYLTRFNDKTSKSFSSIMENKNSNSVNDESAKLAFIIRVHFSHLHEDYKKLLNKSLKFGSFQISSATTIQQDMKVNGFNQERYDHMISSYYISDDLKKQMASYIAEYRKFTTGIEGIMTDGNNPKIEISYLVPNLTLAVKNKLTNCLINIDNINSVDIIESQFIYRNIIT